MSVSAHQPTRRPRLSPFDGVLWALAALLLLPPTVALQSLPWSQYLAPWVIPAVVASGLGIGFALVVASTPRRWWWIALSAAGFLAAAVFVGALLAARGARGAQPPVGAIVLSAYVAALATSLPWLAFRAKQVWLTVLLIWGAVAGAWGSHVTPQQVWWLISLLAASLLFLGLTRLREETRTWQTLQLERLGPVLWPTARVIITLSVFVSLVGLIPLGAARLAALSAALRHTPLSQPGPFSYESASGTPVAELGAPLGLNAPDVSGQQIILTYTLTQSPAITPPLLGATLDTFADDTWQQGAATATTVPTQRPLVLPTGAQLLQGQITVVALPPAGTATTPLLGFDQPLSFSVPARARVIGANDPSPVNITGWEATSPLNGGATYTTTAAVLPDSAAGTGALPPDVVARMTQVPDGLASQLRATAHAWIGAAATPNAQAHALLDAMQAHLVLDPKATPPDGVDGVSWFLTNTHGNVLMWTTAYILLGRSVGLPLRLAEGYLPGQYDLHANKAVVRASDATVWAQLAIPGMGWLDLFPASNEITVQVPKQVIYTGAPRPTPTPQPTQAPRPRQTSPYAPRPQTAPSAGAWALILLGVLLVLVLLTALVGLASLRWRRVGRNLGPLTQLFARIAVLARLAGITLRPSDTAAQATGKVAEHMPEHAEVLATMNGAYERLRYGPPGAPGLLPNLREQWQRLRGALVRLVVTRPWRGGARRPTE